jgi:hypothetical protein
MGVEPVPDREPTAAAEGSNRRVQLRVDQGRRLDDDHGHGSAITLVTQPPHDFTSALVCGDGRLAATLASAPWPQLGTGTGSP